MFFVQLNKNGYHCSTINKSLSWRVKFQVVLYHHLNKLVILA